MPKIKEITLGYSVLNSYRTCPTSFRYRYLETLTRPPRVDVWKGSPLTFGSLVHEFMEHYHTGKRDGLELLDEVLSHGLQTNLANVEPQNQRSLLHLELLLRKYLDQYPDPTSDFEPLIIDGKPALEYEVTFIISTNPLIKWRAHYDGFVRTIPDGRRVILEHKTSSGNLQKDLVERMLPNDQAIGYAFGAQRVLGEDVTGVLFNGLCTYRPLVNPGYKPRSGSGEALPLFHRHMVEIEPWMLREWEHRTLRDVKRMIEDIEESTFGANAPDACTIFNTRCQFADLCKSAPEQRQVLKEFGYISEGWKGWEVKYA